MSASATCALRCERGIRYVAMVPSRAIRVTERFRRMHCLVSRKESFGLRSKSWRRLGYRDRNTRKQGSLVAPVGSCGNALGSGCDALTLVGLAGIGQTYSQAQPYDDQQRYDLHGLTPRLWGGSACPSQPPFTPGNSPERW